MATTIKSTALDFNSIKTGLKNHFGEKTEFNDYDFEASGLSNILDVLAYNTHMNGLTANLALNEAFLSTSQLRSSVVSHAENLGYYPRSITASTATVNITSSTTDTATTNVTLAAYKTFTTSIDEVSYTFNTTEELTGTNNGSGLFTFTNSSGSADIIIKEGTLKVKTFLVGDTTDGQIYVVPDSTLDTSTLDIKVYDNVNSDNYTSYTNIRSSVNVTPTSTIFIVRETPNGYYELTFSEGNVLGKAPVAGNKIVVTYISTKGAAANGAESFSTSETIRLNSTNFPLIPVKKSASSGGDSKESISSIKLNAPTAFAAQQRMVTSEDYKSIINASYSSLLDDIIAWGGQDNIPAKFGVVYVALQFKDGVSDEVKATTKDNISSQLTENLAIMSIDTEFVDPTETFIEMNVKFDFDPDLTGDTAETSQVTVKNKITEFFNNNLNKFDRILRRSSLLTVLDNLSTAILNSTAEMRVQRRLTPTLNSDGKIEVVFPVRLAVPDDKINIITSTRFTYKSTACVLKNLASSNTLQIVNAASGVVLNDNVGNYVESTGTITLTSFNISAFQGSNLKITAVPANQSTIRPLRNHILKFDADASITSAIIDYQNTATVIS